jgi:hypothetical protein
MADGIRVLDLADLMMTDRSTFETLFAQTARLIEQIPEDIRDPADGLLATLETSQARGGDYHAYVAIDENKCVQGYMTAAIKATPHGRIVNMLDNTMVRPSPRRLFIYTALCREARATAQRIALASGVKDAIEMAELAWPEHSPEFAEVLAAVTYRIQGLVSPIIRRPDGSGVVVSYSQPNPADGGLVPLNAILRPAVDGRPVNVRHIPGQRVSEAGQVAWERLVSVDAEQVFDVLDAALASYIDWEGVFDPADIESARTELKEALKGEGRLYLVAPKEAWRLRSAAA